ncbi:hypothetical protein [Methylovirgula sp. 4M-Z18]|uniref:hypothetical protein n=1 Tax=Methylovirgula sp. 4M-Z18 TaxID=2293567 RepID=UPI000E2EF226|nr:hypothetical protein [Methylovirgula sp. 4M-Z18]RFB81370.1 hypothetical protein DYH55_08040 [Methylovirgula sp. 4M-Z18]
MSFAGPLNSSGQQRGRSDMILQIAGATLILLIFLALFGWPIGWGEAMPGDLGDARFNMYVLEHFFRRLSGSAVSFASPHMFYPYPGTLFFSDTHIGTAWIYSIFRALGLDDYMAFKAWFFTGYVLTYAASYYVFLRLGTRPWIAAVGAALFTFSLPSVAQIGHAQLVYRCCVPLAMLAFWQWCQTGRIKLLLRSIFWLNVQMLISVYLGVFLAMLMVLFYVTFIILSPSRWLALRAIPDVRNVLPNIAWRDYLAAAIWIAVAALTIFILHKYQEVSRIYGLKRPFEDVRMMLPRPASYLISSILPYYRDLTQSLGAGIPLPQEHNLFVGVGTLGLFVAGLFGLRSQPGTRCDVTFAQYALIAALLVAFCVTQFAHFTLYRMIGTLPGLHAIRAVARVMLILVFPISVVAVKGIETLWRDGVAAPVRYAVCTVLLFVCGFEIGMADKNTYLVSQSEARIKPIVAAARMRGAAVERPILAVTLADTDIQYIFTEIDASLAAQRLGWPTVNGYSGSMVPGQGTLDCGMALRQYRAYRTWDRKHSEEIDLSDLMRRTIYVGLDDCDRDWRHWQPSAMDISPALATPPDAAIAPLVSLSVASVERREAAIVFKVDVKNGSQDWIRQNLQKPLRLVWRFVPLDGSSEQSPIVAEKIHPDIWDRQDLLDDIAPSGMRTETIATPLPKKAGLYRLEVSMVEEGGFWFHREGMALAVWPIPIKVD